ncbi:MAG: phosphate/phosphite/phosphonate ABC transporter substrate-binding protein [Burkholderiales bacterium]
MRFAFLKMGFLALGLLFSNAALAVPLKLHDFVVSGVVVNSGDAKLLERFARFLSEKTGYPMHVVYASSYTQLSNMLRDHPDSVGWACGAPFVEDHKAYGEQLVAVPLFQGKPLYHSLIIAKKGRSEKHLADFRGEVLAYSDIRSNSGYVSPAYALHQEHIDISKYFRLLIDAGSHEQSIEAVLNGLADVAAVDEYIWVQYAKAHPDAVGKLQVLERMGPYPFTPIVAGTGVDTATMKRFENALTGMKADGRGNVLLGNFGLDGFVLEPVKFYMPIEKMLNAIYPSGNYDSEPVGK